MRPIEVLLIEDSPGDAFLVRLVLAESQTPIKVNLAQDGMQALLMLASETVHPDLIIVDLNLPYISGHQLMERYRQNDIPVVVFSSSWDEEDRKRALSLGAREFIRKPFGAQEYRAAVRHMVEKWVFHRDPPTPDQHTESTPQPSPRARRKHSGKDSAQTKYSTQKV